MYDGLGDQAHHAGYDDGGEFSRGLGEVDSNPEAEPRPDVIVSTSRFWVQVLEVSDGTWKVEGIGPDNHAFRYEGLTMDQAYHEAENQLDSATTRNEED